jgi:type I restriction enzyme S subunit
MMVGMPVPFSAAVIDATGGNVKIQRKDFLTEGRLPVIDQGQEDVAGFTNDFSHAYTGDLPVVLFGDHTRAFKYVDTPFALGADGVKVLTPRAGFNAKFLYYYFLSCDIPSRGYSRHFKFLKEFDIPLFPPSEQSRIVELLDEADRLRRMRREADVKAARILPALFLKMFGDPATNPMRWPVEPLTKICSPKQWPTISAKELTQFGFPVYGANGTIGFYSSYNHEQPTVLITCRGATCGTINVCAPKSYVTGNAMALDEPDLGKTSLEFLECYLNVRGLDDTITGAAQPQITRQNLQIVTVFVPPPGLLADFSRRVRATKALLSGVQSGGDRLEDAFGLLLQRAFSGQLTAQWREARMQELLAEMKQQALALHLPVPTELEALS